MTCNSVHYVLHACIGVLWNFCSRLHDLDLGYNNLKAPTRSSHHVEAKPDGLWARAYIEDLLGVPTVCHFEFSHGRKAVHDLACDHWVAWLACRTETRTRNQWSYFQCQHWCFFVLPEKGKVSPTRNRMDCVGRDSRGTQEMAEKAGNASGRAVHLSRGHWHSWLPERACFTTVPAAKSRMPFWVGWGCWF